MTALFVMVLLVFVDVFLRYFFNRPITASSELIELMMVSVVFLGVAYTHLHKGHIKIDLIVNLLSQRAQVTINSITSFLNVGLFGLITWQSALNALEFSDVGLTTYILRMPVSPFAFLVPFGCLLLTLLLLRDLLNNLAEGIRLQLRGTQWLLLFGVPVLTLSWLIFLLLQPSLPQVSSPIIGIVGIGASLLLFFAGVPVAFAMGMVGFIGILYLKGPNPAFEILGATLYRTTANYGWAPMAFFILMGYFIFYMKFGEDIYMSTYKWLGRMAGGVAQATIAACAGLAAVVGDSLSATITMAAVALPEMKKYKYSPGLSAGCVAAGGALGPVIPPSILFILYAMLTQQSVGKLFLAGIIPGMLLAALWMLSIYMRCRYNPKLGPVGASSSFREKVVSLKATWPILTLFMLVIGGIYSGWFTATEGGGIGAAGAIIIGLILRRVTWQRFVGALLEAGKVIGFVFLLLGCAAILGYFITLSKLPLEMANIIGGLQLPPVAILVAILMVYLVLGCFISAIPLVLITLPVFFPIVMDLGYDPIWFGVIIVLMMNVAGMTPPYGIQLFALKGAAPDIPIGTIYWGVLPFVVIALVCVGLIVIFPQIAIFLPNLLK